ncbi:MAG: N-acetyltransferase [Gammaproteobacteria bacterium]|nr:N-acetyltransferase [Gammaproteobacteria bacterium]
MHSNSALELIAFPLSDRKRVKRFLKMPWHIYREHYPSPNWVPPLLAAQLEFFDPAKNPFFEHAACHCWLVCKDGIDVGRIVAVVDRNWENFTGSKTGQFGFFESINDREVAALLLETAIDWLRKQGVPEVIGPLNFSTNHQSGFLVDGFDSLPCIEMTYNPPYYDELVKACGFTKLRDLWQWEVATVGAIPARMQKLSERLKKRGRFTIRHMNMKDWDAEVERLQEIYNDAWTDTWGFVPLNEQELQFLAANLKLVVQPELALIAELDGEPIAVSITIMDINPLLQKIDGRLFPTGLLRLIWGLKINNTVQSGRVIITGVKHSHQHSGIGSLMYIETRMAIEKLGWKYVNMGWTLEDNDDVNSTARSMDGRIVKTFRVYSREC